MIDQPTGRDLVHQLWIAARAQGVPLGTFVRPLSSDPTKWIKKLREAKCPKPATIARIHALIEGRDLPPSHNRPIAEYSTCTRADRERLGLEPSARQNREERSLTIAEQTRVDLEWRRAIAEAAAERRRPGETLHAAVRRVEQELRAA